MVGHGVFASWEECNSKVSGLKGAHYKKFRSEQEAKAFSENGLLGRAPVISKTVDVAKMKCVTRAQLRDRRSLYLDLRGIVGRWDDGAKMIGDSLKGILCIRNVGQTVYELRLEESEEKRVMELQKVIIRGKEVQVLIEDPRYVETTVVKVKDFPFSWEISELTDFFNDKGWKLMGVPIEGTCTFGDRLCLSGDVFLRIRVVCDDMVLPSEIEIKDVKIKLSGQRVQKACSLCGSISHLANKCPEIVCYQCHGKGHFAKNCVVQSANEEVEVSSMEVEEQEEQEEQEEREEQEEQEEQEERENCMSENGASGVVVSKTYSSCVSDGSPDRRFKRRAKSTDRGESPVRENRSPLESSSLKEAKNPENWTLLKRPQGPR